MDPNISTRLRTATAVVRVLEALEKGKTFNEADHPRHPAGSEKGGEFSGKGGLGDFRDMMTPEQQAAVIKAGADAARETAYIYAGLKGKGVDVEALMEERGLSGEDASAARLPDMMEYAADIQERQTKFGDRAITYWVVPAETMMADLDEMFPNADFSTPFSEADFVVEFQDDPRTTEPDNLIGMLRPVDFKALKARLLDEAGTDAAPTTLDEALGHENHHVRGAAFRAALDAFGVAYRVDGKELVASEYVYVQPTGGVTDPDEGPQELKVRFADHTRQAALRDTARFNLSDANADGTIKALVDILSDPIYSPAAKKIKKAMETIYKAKEFDPSKHPRHEKGKAEGGQFKPKDGGYGKSMSDWLSGLTPWWMKPNPKDFAGAEKGPPKGSAQHPHVNDKGEAVTIYNPTKPTPESTWMNADEVASWSPGTKTPDSLHGVPFSSWADVPKDIEGWANVEGQLDIDEPPLVLPKGKRAGAGVVIAEPDGRIWLVKPTNEYGGYVNSIPKGTVESGLSFQATAIKETWEESGLKIRIKGILGDIERDMSVARIYVAERVGGTPADMGWEAQAVRLVPRKLLDKFLNRKADREVMDAFLTSANLYKAFNPNQPRWPAGTPLGGQWMNIDASGLPTPPKVGSAGNPAYGLASSMLFDAAKGGNKKTIEEFVAEMKAKLAEKEGQPLGWHAKQNAKNLQYAEYLLSSMDKQTQAGASAAKITGPASIEGWKTVGPKPGGSAKGGGAIMEDENGTKWLVKGYKNDGMAQNEVLAAQLYNAAIPGSAPEMQAVKLGDKFGGGIGVASKWIDSKGLNPTDPVAVHAARAGFATDAWLANWDAVGLEYDNIRIDAEGNSVRVDPGGSLLYRAQGTPKGPAFGVVVGEIDTLRDPKMNPTSAKIFGGMTADDIYESSKAVEGVSTETIKKLVDAYGPGSKSDKEALANKLIDRRDNLYAQMTKLIAPKEPIPAFVPAGVGISGIDQPIHHGDTFDSSKFETEVANIEAAYYKGDVAELDKITTAHFAVGTKDNDSLAGYSAELYSKLKPPQSFAQSIAPKFNPEGESATKYGLTQEKHDKLVADLDGLHQKGDAATIKQIADVTSTASDDSALKMHDFANKLLGDLEAKADPLKPPVWKTDGKMSKSSFDSTLNLINSFASATPDKAGEAPVMLKTMQKAWDQAHPAGKGENADALKAHLDAKVTSFESKVATPSPPTKPMAPVFQGLFGSTANKSFDTAVKNVTEFGAQGTAKDAEDLKSLASIYGDSKVHSEFNKTNLVNYATKMAAYVEAKQGGKAAAAPVSAEPKLITKPAPPAHITGPKSGVGSYTFGQAIELIDATAANGDIAKLNEISANWNINNNDPEYAGANNKALGLYAKKMADYVEARQGVAPAIVTNISAPLEVTGTTKVAPALPDFEKYKTTSQANKVSHNGKIDAIAQLAKEGNVNGILAMSFGSKQSYSKTQTIAANDALAALGSPHKVVMGQKKGQHPALGGETSDVAISARAAGDLIEAYQKGGKFDSSKLPTPPDYLNWNGPGKGLSSKPDYNAANQAEVNKLLEIAKTGSIAKIQEYAATKVDTVAWTSKYIGQFKDSLIQNIDSQLNPPPPPKPLPIIKSVDHLKKLGSSYEIGTAYASIKHRDKVGYWLALGVTNANIATWAEGPSQLNDNHPWVKEQFKKYQTGKFSPAFKAAIQAQQGDKLPTAYRQGSVKVGDWKLSNISAAMRKESVELPAGTKLLRYVDMPPAMVNQLLATKKGTVFEDTSPMATSFTVGGYKAASQAKIDFITMPGVKMMPAFSSGKYGHEREITTIPGQRFVVLGVKMRKNGSLKIKAALLPSHW